MRAFVVKGAVGLAVALAVGGCAQVANVVTVCNGCWACATGQANIGGIGCSGASLGFAPELPRSAPEVPLVHATHTPQEGQRY